jgi:hypothetical protein
MMHVCHIPFWVWHFFLLPYLGRTPVFNFNQALASKKKNTLLFSPPNCMPFHLISQPSCIFPAFWGWQPLLTPVCPWIFGTSLGFIFPSLPFSWTHGQTLSPCYSTEWLRVVCTCLYMLLLLWDFTMGQVSLYSPTLPLKVVLVPCPLYI